MHVATKRFQFLSSLLLPGALLLIGCDRGDGLESPDEEAERDAEVTPAGEREGRPPAEAHARGGKKVDRLCEKLECTADQRGRIEGVAERMRGERPTPRGDRDAANRALAEAFGGEGFSSADVTAYRAVAGPDVDGLDAKIVAGTVELHGILDAEQREALALKIERNGLPFARGPKHGPKHGGEQPGDRAGSDERGPGDRGARMAARLCGEIACTEAQHGEIATLMQTRPEQGEVAQADRSALASAFRGESLPEAAVAAYLGASAKARAAEHEALAARVVELHGLLTAEQRGKLAARIAVDGPRGLGLRAGGEGRGKKGRHGKRGGHGKKGDHAKRGGRGKKGDRGPRGEHGVQGVG